MKEIRARVIIQEKGYYTISYEGKENIAEVSGKFRHEALTVSDYPAVGDYVIASWPEDGSHSIISCVFPRKSVFIRKAAGTGKQEQVVAANIDTIFLCMSLNQDFNLRRLERYIAVAWDSGATPVVVLTKADLCENVEEKETEVTTIAAGVDVVTVSSWKEEIDRVKSYLIEGKTVAFIGSSGVGKSTLINKLIGEDTIRTAEIRKDDDKGRHTTTHRELIMLPNGAYVIDTPGMRELGMWNNEEGMETAFSDVEELMKNCRFSNCTHTGEPGCKVIQALQDGILEEGRWKSYLKLKMENEYSADAEQYLMAKKEKFHKIAKMNRNNKKR